MKRRSLLKLFAVAAAWVRVPYAGFAQQPTISAADEARVRALAEAVLPSELTPAGRSEVVDTFLRWLRNYREGAEMDHGYGFTRLRQLPASPAAKYPAQLAALDRTARVRGAAFETLDVAARRAVVAAAVDTAKIERLPVRPTGDHIATDLMGFYFHGEAANDLAYRAAIRRDSCRGLPGSESTPNRLGTSSERVQNPESTPNRLGTSSERVQNRLGTSSERVQSQLGTSSERVQNRFGTSSERVQNRLGTSSERVQSGLRTRSESVQSEVTGRLNLQGRGT